MHLRRFFFIILILCLFVSPAMGVKVTVHPDGGDSDQKAINDAFKKVAQFGGGEVYLEGEDGNNVFTVTGSCVFESDNTKLTGDSNAILSVSPKSSQWFTGTNSIIYSNSHDNIEISGFQIDGNCEQLPFNYHKSRSDTAHDCERAIIISGQTNSFCENISVHDMQIYDCFSDGMNIRFATGVHVYNNFISNCQHEGIFLTSVINGLTESNEIFGITSDCIRLDNVVNNIVQYNYCYSYTGDHNSQAPKGKQNGIQIANAGSSHGYDASNKPTSTTNVEVRYNKFINTGDKAVWLDSTGKGYDNVYIHDNEFENVKEFTNDGEPVIITGIDPSKPISYENPPTKETSEKIFSSIFDIMNTKFVEKADKNATIKVDGNDYEGANTEASWTVEQHDLGNLSYTLVYGSTEGLSSVQYEVNGVKTKHTLMLGEQIGFEVLYTKVSSWDGELPHQGDALKLEGIIQPEEIKITCNTPTDSFTPETKLIFIQKVGNLFSPLFIWSFIIVLISLIYDCFVLKYTL